MTEPTEMERKRARQCPTCNGYVIVRNDPDNPRGGMAVSTRETEGLVCQTCGWDYARDGEP